MDPAFKTVVDLAGRKVYMTPKSEVSPPRFNLDERGMVRVWEIEGQRWRRLHPVDAVDWLKRGVGNLTGAQEPEPVPSVPADLEAWPLESSEESYVEKYGEKGNLSELVTARLELARARISAGVSAGSSSEDASE